MKAAYLLIPFFVLAAGCGKSFTDYTRTDGRISPRYFADVAKPEGANYQVPSQEISFGKAQTLLAYYEGTYDRSGLLHLLRRYVQSRIGWVVQTEVRYYYDRSNRRVREVIRIMDDYGRIRAGERLYDPNGTLVIERELDMYGRPIQPKTPAPKPDSTNP
ncbi:MAG: hypothetical protein JXA82_18965 [Sedimentisphaerales bacterium]|nr:hypothetical protein [Sedimentisphaerales bacterium]